MATLFVWLARIFGVIGIALTAGAVATRLAGSWYLAGIQIATVLQLGIAAMLIGCLAYLATIAERTLTARLPD